RSSHGGPSRRASPLLHVEAGHAFGLGTPPVLPGDHSDSPPWRTRHGRCSSHGTCVDGTLWSSWPLASACCQRWPRGRTSEPLRSNAPDMSPTSKARGPALYAATVLEPPRSYGRPRRHSTPVSAVERTVMPRRRRDLLSALAR